MYPIHVDIIQSILTIRNKAFPYHLKKTNKIKTVSKKVEPTITIICV